MQHGVAAGAAEADWLLLTTSRARCGGWSPRRAPLSAAAGIGAWAAMAVTAAPVLRLHGLSPLRGLALPVVGTLYAAMTVGSARRHETARGVAWKGRIAGSWSGSSPSTSPFAC